MLGRPKRSPSAPLTRGGSAASLLGFIAGPALDRPQRGSGLSGRAHSQQRASSQIEPAQIADRYPAPPDAVRRAAQPWRARIACSSWSARRRQDTQNGRDDPLGAIRPTNCARTMEARGRSRPAFVSIRTILRRHARTCFPACGPTMSTPCVPL